LQAAWAKYGEECFVFEVVEPVDDFSTLLAIENKWLRSALGHDKCYNSAPSAGTTWLGVTGEAHPAYGSRRTEDVKQRMSESIKAWAIANPDKVAKGSRHYRYGKTLSAEVRQKIGDAQRGVKKAPRVISAGGRAKIAAAAAAGAYGHQRGRVRPRSEMANIMRPVREMTTGAVFEALNDALRFYGLKMPTLRRALKTGKPISKGPLAGLRFEYLTRIGDLPEAPAVGGGLYAGQTPTLDV
jgi:hypothetical protein